MAQRGRKNADQVLAMTLAFGATLEAAAEKAGVSAKTAYRRSKDPSFRERILEIRAELVTRTSATITAAGQEFVKTLLELVKPPTPPAVRLGAAKAGLEIGMKAREIASLETRIAAMEQQLASLTGGGNQ
jgi:hypothetical protein